MKKFFKSKENFISFAVALIPSIMFWIFKPADSVPFGFLIVSILIIILLLWLFLQTYYCKIDEASPPPITIIGCYEKLLLCRPNILLSQDAFVSFYLKANEFEKIVGYGFVSNVQSNGLIQITIIEEIDFSFDDANCNLQNIIIKPTVTISYINQKLNERGETS